MPKFMAQNMNTQIKGAFLVQLPVGLAKAFLYTGPSPDMSGTVVRKSNFTPLVGTLADGKDVTLGAIHNHDVDFDAFHLNPMEFVGDNDNPDQAATGYFVMNDDGGDDPILFAEEFGEPLLFINSLSAHTIIPKILLPRGGTNVVTQIVE